MSQNLSSAAVVIGTLRVKKQMSDHVIFRTLRKKLLMNSVKTELCDMTKFVDPSPTNNDTALCVPIEFPTQFDTVQSGWSIAYIEGSQIHINSKKYYFFL